MGGLAINILLLNGINTRSENTEELQHVIDTRSSYKGCRKT